jgi:hypothetical protein
MKRDNIMAKPEEEKVKVYEEINRYFEAGEKVEMKEHRSGFPAVTVDCGDIHILTDILSLETWWKGRKSDG